METKKVSKCPVCGSEYKSKTAMACEILKIIGCEEKKSQYSDGNFTAKEMSCVYKYIIDTLPKGKR